MKKIFLFLFLIISTISFGQVVRTLPSGMGFQQFGTPSTMTQINGILYNKVGFAGAIYADTATMNLNQWLKTMPFARASTMDGKSWVRNLAATQWLEEINSGNATSGTVVSVSGLAPLFTVSNPTTTPAFSLISQSANKFFASPNGSSGFASFRSIAAADIAALISLTTKGVTTATYNSSTGAFNIPKDQWVGVYLNIGKSYTRSKPLVIGSVLLGLGNSWISGIFSGGTPYMAQLGAYFGKTVFVGSAVLGGDLNTLVSTAYPYGTFGNDTTTFVDVTMAPAFGLCTSGQPFSGIYYNDHPNSPQLTETKNYIYGTYKAFIANHYLDNDWFSVSSLADANFRNAVSSDSLGSKSTPGVIGLGAFSFTKPAGKTSVVIGTYGADSTRVRQGTITVQLAGNTIYSKYFNGLNDGNKGNNLVIKAGLNYEAIVLQNLPDSAATVTVTCSGDSTRFDYIGYLKPKEKAVRPLYISNIGYGSANGLFIIPINYIDSANQMLQNAVMDFVDYPVYIQNTNNWLDSLTNVGNPTVIHLTASGNDSVAKAYESNLTLQSYTSVNNAAWTQSGNNANYLPGNVGVGTSTPNSTLHTNGSFATAYVAKTGTYPITSSDYTVECTANTFTVTLPTAVGITGRMYFITNSGAGTITVATTSSQTFVNVSTTPTSLTLATLTGVLVQSNGVNWLKVSGF